MSCHQIRHLQVRSGRELYTHKWNAPVKTGFVSSIKCYLCAYKQTAFIIQLIKLHSLKSASRYIAHEHLWQWGRALTCPVSHPPITTTPHPTASVTMYIQGYNVLRLKPGMYRRRNTYERVWEWQPMFVRNENELFVEFGEPCPVLSPCLGEV